MRFYFSGKRKFLAGMSLLVGLTGVIYGFIFRANSAADSRKSEPAVVGQSEKAICNEAKVDLEACNIKEQKEDQSVLFVGCSGFF